jgi:nucleoside-triphosphatase THEP1
MTTRIPVVENILSANDRMAERNRALLDGCSTYSINIMASPGAGKTSLILKTLESLNRRRNTKVLSPFKKSVLTPILRTGASVREICGKNFAKGKTGKI